jgi:hypothetical protein
MNDSEAEIRQSISDLGHNQEEHFPKLISGDLTDNNTLFLNDKLGGSVKEYKAQIARFKELSASLTPEENMWIREHNAVMAKIAKKLNIPVNEGYITRQMEKDATSDGWMKHNGKYTLDENDRKIPEKTWVPADEIGFKRDSVNNNFLRERLGAKGYKLSATESEQAYIDWFAKRTAGEKWQPQMLDIIGQMGKLDQHMGEIANMYYLNYFGKTSEIPLWQIDKRLANKISSYVSNAWLTGNPTPAILNNANGLLGGSARIGYGPTIKGIEYYNKIRYGTDAEAQRWRDILFKGAVTQNKSIFEIAPNRTIYDKIPGVSQLSDWSKGWLQNAENRWKSILYLGCYDDTLTKISAYQNMLAKGDFDGANKIGKWLQVRDIDLTKSAEEEAHIYARTQAFKGHPDWTKTTASWAQIDPRTNLLVKYRNFGLKWTEYNAEMLRSSGEVLGKALFGGGDLGMALQHPDVTTLARSIVNYGSASYISGKLGINLARYIWEPTTSLFENAANLFVPIPTQYFNGFSKVIKSFKEKDPDAYMNAFKYGTFALGVPFQNLGWKTAHLIETILDNRGNPKTGDVFIADPRDEKHIHGFHMNAIQYLSGLIAGAPGDTQEQYYDNLKNKSEAGNKARNLRKAILRQAYGGKDVGTLADELAKAEMEKAIATMEYNSPDNMRGW